MSMSIADRLTKLRVVALAFVVAAGLGLAACGGGDDSSSSDSGSAGSSSSSSDLNQQFDDELEKLRSTLAQSSGLPNDVADCIIDHLKTDLSDAEIQSIIDAGGTIPSDLQSKLTKLGQECASGGGGG